MPEMRLQDFLTSALDSVTIEPDELYATVGVLNRGRGLFTRPTIEGRQTKYKKYFRVRANQFVYSKLFAWEGALAVVPDSLDGYFVSQEFPTFDIDVEKVLPNYLRLLCQWPPLWDLVKSAEAGMGGRRKRVRPERLLALRVYIPPMRQQLKLVELMAAVDNVAQSYQRSEDAARVLARGLRQNQFVNTDAVEEVAAEDFFEVTIGRQRSPSHATGEQMLPYLRAANVKDGYLDLRDVKSMNFDELERVKYSLQDGDTLVTEGCGSLAQLGASAQWKSVAGEQPAFQNTLIRLRGVPGLSASDYAYQWAKASFEAGIFAAQASGTNIFHLGRGRLAALPVGKIALSAQEKFIQEVQSVDDVIDALRHAQDKLKELRLSVLYSECAGISTSMRHGAGF